MRFWMLLLAPFILVVGLCAVRALAFQTPPAATAPAVAPNTSTTMPIKKLTLHTNGLALVRREAELTGPVTFDLPVPIGDVNDWLKSLDIDDPAGRTETVVFDSPEPVERSLQSFAFDLTGNPAFGELLNQGRGERIEVTLVDGATTSRHAGTLLGLEERIESVGLQNVATDYLNLRLDDGLRSVPLRQVRSVKFVDARLDADLQRALALVAGSKDDSRKSVRVTIPAGAKRTVSITHVAEMPVWKVSYRLNSTGAETQLRSWAIVENTTDEDWTDVKLTLAGGRPVSFRMDLYPPLFVPRPFVDPPRMAALRPPSYAGPLQAQFGFQGNNQQAFLGGGAGAQGGALGFAGGGNQTPGGVGGGFGQLGGGARYLQQNTLTMEEDAPAMAGLSRANRYQFQRRRGSFDSIGRISLEEYERRQKEVGDEKKSSGTVTAASTDEPVGTPARYVIEQAVTIPRHKSALIPIISKNVAAAPVAVYSPDVHATRPLAAYRVKNETTQTLAAGPVTVYDSQGFAGDARITDWPADEERFVGFALDADVQMARKETPEATQIVSLRITQGVINEERRFRVAKDFVGVNRGKSPRVVWIELPVEDGWRMIEPAKPDESAKGRFRVRTEIPTSQRVQKIIRLERTSSSQYPLENLSDSDLRLLVQNEAIKPQVRAGLQTLMQQREQVIAAGQDVKDASKALEGAQEEQNRLRTNMEKAPPSSDLQKRFLEKLGQQETEIERLQSRIRTRQQEMKATADQIKTTYATLTLE